MTERDPIHVMIDRAAGVMLAIGFALYLSGCAMGIGKSDDFTGIAFALGTAEAPGVEGGELSNAFADIAGNLVAALESIGLGYLRVSPPPVLPPPPLPVLPVAATAAARPSLFVEVSE